MKKMIASVLFSSLITIAFAQDFPGYRAGNYTGVNGVFFNPASIADSRYRFDVNLFSFHTQVGNNQASFRLKNLGETFNSDDLSDKIFSSTAGPSSGTINMDFHGPSVMFNAGNKTSIALTTRARALANVIDMDGKLVNQLSDDVGQDIQFPYSFSSDADMRLVANAWTEFGVSMGRILSDKGKHFFKGGITLKYLGGVGNAYINLARLRGTLNEDVLGDVYLSNSTGRIATGFGGVALSDFDAGNFTNFRNSGFGTDLGLVYEFRPEFESYKIDSNTWMNDRNKYKFKVGFALLDIGSIKYSRDPQSSGSYDVDITGSEQFNLRELADTEIEDYNSFFQSRPQYFTPAAGNAVGSYKVALPTTLQLDVDYHLHRGFYAHLATQIPISSKKEFNSRYFSGFSLTPRYEGRVFGFYLPLNYNSLTKFNAGVSLRVGPMFIGSGSVLSALIGNSKQADFHFGIRFGGLKKKPKSPKVEADSTEGK